MLRAQAPEGEKPRKVLVGFALLLGGAFLARSAFGALVRHLLTQFDHVIVDTPAAVHGADAKVIAAQCGTAIALGRKGMSTVRSLQKLVTSLEKSATRISGVIINER